MDNFTTQNVVILILAVMVSLLLSSVISFLVHKRRLKRMLADAEENAKRVLEEARRDADQLVQSSKQELRDDAKRRKQKFEEESKQRRSEVSKLENKIKQREQSLDKKLQILEKRENELEQESQTLALEQTKYQKLNQEKEQSLEESRSTLQKIASMTPQEAKRELMRSMEQDARAAAKEIIDNIEENAQREALHRSRSILSASVQKMAGTYVNDSTISVLTLPSDEMKGRIIGREGRNIRAIEQSTGVDLIVDDTPEVVIISSFNPVRREIAKQTIEKLIADGRIHPARIEETAKKVEEEFDSVIREFGEKAAFDAGVTDLEPNLVELLGKLNFRTTGNQSVLSHSIEVANICSMMAFEMGLDPKLSKRMGLLHDIGIAADHEIDGPHHEVGANLCEKYGERDEVVDAIRLHHQEDLTNASPYGVVLHTANFVSTERPGARKEQLQAYIQRLQDMENKVKEFKGIEQAYVMQAGREIRVMVSPDVVDDENVKRLSSDIAHKVRKEISSPGQIRVTVLRENRSIEFAK